MTEILLLLALAALVGLLVRFARHDRFSGPHTEHDDFGPTWQRPGVVPRWL